MTGFFIDCHEADEFIKGFLKADLDEGEAAAIAQADYKKAVLLLDEKDGYKRAGVMKLTTFRTTHLLKMLKAVRAISEVKPYLQKLEDTGFYLKAEVRRRLLAEVGEEE
jgi:predicted nucleic acid-binding protein